MREAYIIFNDNENSGIKNINMDFDNRIVRILNKEGLLDSVIPFESVKRVEYIKAQKNIFEGF